MRKEKPSRTAFKVALNIVTLGAKQGMDRYLPAGVVQATAQLLLASGVAGPKTIKWAQSSMALRVYEAFDWMLPGQYLAFAHRKSFCERQVRDGIEAGATQIIVLGSGYDTLGWRLAPEFPNVNFFEIDHPATARFKAEGIEKMGSRGNLFLMAEDLGRSSLMDVLSTNSAWDMDAQTVMIAEGLVMYLTSEAVNNLFDQCALCTGDESRVAFSYIPSGEDGRPDVGRWTGLMLWLQSVAGEPWLWSVQPRELDLFLSQTGWESAPELAKTNGKHGVEFFAVAKK